MKLRPPANSFQERFINFTDKLCLDHDLQLKELHSHFGLNFAPGVFSNYRTGRNNPRMDILIEMQDKLPGFDLAYMITGRHQKQHIINVQDEFNAPNIHINDKITHDNSKQYTSPGHYVVIFEGVKRVMNIQKTQECYRIIPGCATGFEPFCSTEIEFIGKAISITKPII